MTLYTLDTKAKYLIASAVVLLCSLVYEHFSHGVYSAFMLGAFLIPLIVGALPCLVYDRYGNKKRAGENDNSAAAGLHLASVATLTAGSFMQGVLEIYGTTNSLMTIYPLVGISLAIAAIYMSVKRTIKSF